MENYPYSCLEKALQGKKVTLVGVCHNGASFKEHKNFYAQKISENDALVLEAGTLHMNPHQRTPDNLPWQLNGEFSRFFGPLLEMAMVSKKSSFILDPYNEPSREWYGMQERYWPLGVVVGAGIGITGLLTKSPSLGWAGLALELGSLNFSHWFEIIPSLARWDYHDYRDIKISQGIKELCEKREEKRILAIHGEGHSKGISFYLDHPRLARLKLLSYLGYERTAKKQGTEGARQIKELMEHIEPITEEDMEECPKLALYYSPQTEWRSFVQEALSKNKG